MQNDDDDDDDGDDDDNDDDAIKICHIRPQSGTSSKLPRGFLWNFSPKNSENPNLIKKSTNQKFWFCIKIKRRFPTPITSVNHTETLLQKYWLEDFKLLFFNWLKE